MSKQKLKNHLKGIIINNDNTDYNGTSLQGYIDISYWNIKKVLGKSSDTFDNYKCDAEWIIKWPDGTVATIYNYKDGKNYLGSEGTPVSKITEWHIGGRDKQAVEYVNKLFKKGD